MPDPQPERGPLWTADAVAEACNGEWLVRPTDEWRPTTVSYDNTVIAKGCLLFCRNPWTWRSDAPNAALDLKRAAAQGCSAAVIQHEQRATLPPLPPDFPLLLVKNSRRAITDLGYAARARYKGKVVALTGTVGKTTSREMIRNCLDPQGGAVSTRGNNNNLTGVSRTMAYTHEHEGYSVVEMGFGFPLNAISKSSHYVRPHVALLTAIDIAHLNVWDRPMTRDEALHAIAQQKCGIFDHLTEDGVAVISRDIPVFDYCKELAQKHAKRVVTFGRHEEAECRLLGADKDATGSVVRAKIFDREVEYRINVPGDHMAVNSVGALAVVSALGADLDVALEAMPNFRAVTGRSEVVLIPVEGGAAELINDTANITPASVVSSLGLLDLLAPRGNGRRVAVFGEIPRLGPDGPRLHRELAPQIAEASIDKLFTIGPLMKEIFERVPPQMRGTHANNEQELLEVLRFYLRADDVVTMKSGVHIRMKAVAHALRNGRNRL